MADGERRSALVIDSGSGMMKAGFAGDDAPVSVFQHTFTNGLRAKPSEHNVLFTEPPLNPKIKREKTAQIAFEAFEIPGTYIGIDGVLAMYAAGHTSGLVLDSGYDVTHAIPVFEEYSMPHSVKRLDLAGNDLTNYMATLLAEQGTSLITSTEKEIAREIKESVCYVSYDVDSEQADNSTEYTFPDGNVLSVGEARYRVPEALSNPALVGKEAQGIHQVVFNSVTKCDTNIQKDLFANIILSGGNTMFPNLENCLLTEITNLVPASTKAEVIAPPERNYSTWIGGSILSSLSTFENMWITKAEYEEEGPSVVHCKCS
ncbi:hypothetical protein OEA41_007693 [Lepraria neglecta]|uniref:Centractin n=1 Tax=Lepraria neglecta TaxID=209136 RepID=A0AAE0DQM2_9LECA|nr:hypothetical protein OEA41_007693 [Lepraria neglecta]